MYDKTNFFHHFNPSKKQNYSEDEVLFVLEVLARVKRGRLTDGERVKIKSELLLR